MSNVFKYSVLKYVHSQFLGEELNLGIVLFFPNQNKLIFKSPKKISRFKYIYRTFTDSVIREYLQAFDEKAKVLSNEKLPESFQSILNDYFLVKDASTLQFDEVKSVVLYTEDTEKIADQYFRLYFPDEFPLESVLNNEISTQQIRHVTDAEVTKAFKNLLLEKDKTIRKYLKPAFEIRNDKAHFKADLVWQNGTINAVKGISFDLNEEHSISDKALLVNAKLNYLREEASLQNIRFDLLVTAPAIKDLTKAYQNALQILSDINVNKQIITQDKLQEYTQRTVNEVER